MCRTRTLLAALFSVHVPAQKRQGCIYYVCANDTTKHVTTFTGDTAIFSDSKNTNLARGCAQRHLNLITEYFHKWTLKFNADNMQKTYLTQRKKNITLNENLCTNSEKEEDEAKAP